MKFKVGDKVRVNQYKGDILFGVVKEIMRGDYPVCVDINSNYDMYCSLDSLSFMEDVSIGDRLDMAIKDLKDHNIKIKDIRLDKLKQLIKAVNTLGEFGKEVELKITIELDGKKIEL